MSFLTETIYISLILFLKGTQKKRLLGPVCTCSLSSGEYFVINSQPPFLNLEWDEVIKMFQIYISLLPPSLFETRKRLLRY